MSDTRQGDWVEDEDTRARLILDLPSDFDLAALEDAVASLPSGTVAALTVPAKFNAVEPLAGLSASFGVALLARVGNEATDTIDPLCNGCLLADRSVIAQFRSRFGPDFIIGAGIGLSRHDAMVAGEAGADYVVFGATARGEDASPRDLEDLCAWWSEVMVLPCAVGGLTTVEQAKQCAEAGADFLILGEAIWQAAAAPRDLLYEYAQAITDTRR